MAYFILLKIHKLKSHSLPLRPNCLLTQKPIVYLYQWSFFNFFNRYFQNAKTGASTLIAHGYDCKTIPVTMSTARNTDKIKSLLSSLQTYIPSAHFYIEKSIATEELHRQLHKLYPDADLYYFESQTPISEHLDQAISLAENDFRCSYKGVESSTEDVEFRILEN